MLRRFVAGALLGLSLPVGIAQADNTTIATTSIGTSVYYYGLAIAKAADEIASMDMRPKPYQSPSQGAVFVNKGETDFGLANAPILREAYQGLKFYKGRRLEHLRAIARLVPVQITIGVRGDSNIETVEDLRGKRFPAGFDSTAFGERLSEAMLRTGGLSYKDVKTVRVSDWKALGQAFVRGKIDANMLVVGSQTATRYAQLVEGYRGLSLTTGPAAEKRLREVFPDARLTVVQPAEELAGIRKPTVALEYDFWLFAHKDTPDSKVSGILRSLWQGKDILSKVSKEFRNFDPASMQGDIGVPFHPAAEAFYAAHKDSARSGSK